MKSSRYNVAGAVTLFRGQAYNARISYLPAPPIRHPSSINSANAKQSMWP